MFNSKAKMERVRELYLGLPETFRTELMSAFHTIIPVFFGTLAVFFQSASEIPWTKEAVIALIVASLTAAFRAVFKALSMWIFTRILPDPKN